MNQFPAFLIVFLFFSRYGIIKTSYEKQEFYKEELPFTTTKMFLLLGRHRYPFANEFVRPQKL